MNDILERVSIIAWLTKYGIKTEKGDPITFHDHPFLYDVYRDMSPKQVTMKAAQVGMSTLQNIKPFWLASVKEMEVVYTMPTDSDVVDFVGGRTNRIIAQNPILQKLTKDRDTVEQKQVGKSLIYYRGTWTKKAAMSVPADLLIHDELDSSKLDIISDYETRLQHSKYKWCWVFSHPSTEGIGVHKYWLLSDQKHWFITCEFCKKEQYMEWPYSFDEERKLYICKHCGAEISDKTRIRGRWVQKYKDREWSGYWIPLFICPWVSAEEIFKKFYEKDPEYFSTKVLGLPYVGAGNKVVSETIFRDVRNEKLIPRTRVIIGVDTGIDIHYVCSSSEGVFKYGSTGSYDAIEDLLRLYPQSIAVFDQGGDLIKPRELQEKYRGRIYLCYYQRDKTNSEMIRWGQEGTERAYDVYVDRNRMISFMIGEFENGRVPLYGSKDYWHIFYTHFANMYRTKEENKLTKVLEYKWERSGPDHIAHAYLYSRVGLERFGVPQGRAIGSAWGDMPDAPMMTPDGKISNTFKNLV